MQSIVQAAALIHLKPLSTCFQHSIVCVNWVHFVDDVLSHLKAMGIHHT